MMKIREEIFDLAVSQAKKSTMRHRHGSVIWKSGKILGAGYNFALGASRRFSIHSEKDALKGLRFEQTHGANLLCIRLTVSQGLMASSCPCTGCTGLLKRRGLKSLFWFDSFGNLNRTLL